MSGAQKSAQRGARRAQPEAAIQRAVFQHLEVRGARDAFAFHPANGGWRSPAEASILKGLGVRAGVPDIVVIKAGQAFALELKASGGRLTSIQSDTHAALRAAGATVAVAYGLDEALAQLDAWAVLCGKIVGGTRR